MFTNKPPLSLYIHIPWCVRKCPYCDFNSHAAKNELPEQNYVQGLLTDLQQDLTLTDNRPIHSVFIGGGTPSLFSPESIHQLLEGIKQHCDISATTEITMEANPGTVEQQRFAGFRRAGINRLSLGIQSFDDEKLKALGRIHDSRQAHQAIDIAKAAGFDNLNLDLMFALPDQSVDEACEDLRQALAHEPQHLSWYQLTLEPNTVFYRYPPPLPDDDLTWEIQQAGQDILSEHGFQQYEVSAYCRDKQFCQHNINYWQFGDYIGIGAGAHGKITQDDQIIRTRKIRQPQTYIEKQPEVTVEKNTLTMSDLVFEFMLNNMRLNREITYDLFQQRTGLDKTAIMPIVEQASQENLLTVSDDGFEPNSQGKKYLNDLLELFL